MTTDHNEAMRQHARDSRELRELCKQRDAARAETNRIIALLDAANDERKALRAEVERLRVDAAELRAALWHVKHVAKDIDAAKTIAGDAIDTARKATP